jgi:transposase-like protein
VTKYDLETKERVVRLFGERRSEAPEESQLASYRRLHELTGIPVDTMRGWVNRAQVDAGQKPGLATAQLFLMMVSLHRTMLSRVLISVIPLRPNLVAHARLTGAARLNDADEGNLEKQDLFVAEWLSKGYQEGMGSASVQTTSAAILALAEGV